MELRLAQVDSMLKRPQLPPAAVILMTEALTPQKICHEQYEGRGPQFMPAARAPERAAPLRWRCRR